MSARRASAIRWIPAAARLSALVVVHALWLAPASAQESARPPFEQEAAKQDNVYRSQGEKVPSGYITERGLNQYSQFLSTGFDAALRRLSAADRWLDIGAGSGRAILDYHASDYASTPGRKGARPRGRARAVAISIEDRRTDLWVQRAASLEPGQISYLFGRRLREYSDEELGKFRLITDVYGGFSYTEELSLFTQRVLGLLEVNGSFYSLLQSVRLANGKDNPKTWYLTELVDKAGRDVKVCSWLKRIACVKVACESHGEWETPTEVIHIRKVCNAVSVPALVRLQYEAGTPPGRRFQLAR